MVVSVGERSRLAASRAEMVGGKARIRDAQCWMVVEGLSLVP